MNRKFRDIVYFQPAGKCLNKQEIATLRPKDHQYFRRKTLVFHPTVVTDTHVSSFELRVAECNLEDQFVRVSGIKEASAKAPILIVTDVKSDEEYNLLVDALIFATIVMKRSVLSLVNTEREEFLEIVAEASAELEARSRESNIIQFVPEGNN